MEDEDERRSLHYDALNDCIEMASRLQQINGADTGAPPAGMQYLELSTQCDDVAAVAETGARALLAQLNGFHTHLDNSILFAHDLIGGCQDAAVEVSRERAQMTMEFIQTCLNEHNFAVGGRLALELAADLPVFLKANDVFIQQPPSGEKASLSAKAKVRAAPRLTPSVPTTTSDALLRELTRSAQLYFPPTHTPRRRPLRRWA